MTISDLLNISGILTLMFGGCLGLVSSFSERNKDIVNRTAANFGNIEFYKSMILQRYLNIFSFFSITLGSFLLLFPYILGNTYGSQKICYPSLIISAIIFTFFLSYIVMRKWISYNIDRLTVSNQIILLNQKKEKKLDDYNLNLIIEILKQRRLELDFSDFDKIIERAKEYFKL